MASSAVYNALCVPSRLREATLVPSGVWERAHTFSATPATKAQMPVISSRAETPSSSNIGSNAGEISFRGCGACGAAVATCSEHNPAITASASVTPAAKPNWPASLKLAFTCESQSRLAFDYFLRESIGFRSLGRLVAWLTDRPECARCCSQTPPCPPTEIVSFDLSGDRVQTAIRVAEHPFLQS
jgi:hypothetical protein